MSRNSYFNGKRISSLLATHISARSESEIQELAELTSSVSFFTKFREKYSDSLHKECCKFLHLEKFTKNQYIYELGDTSSKYYILLKGRVSLLSKKEDLEVSSDSSSSYEELMPVRLRSRNRSNAVIITSEDLFDFSTNQLKNRQKNDPQAIPEDMLEANSKELLEFIMQFNRVDEDLNEVKTLNIGDEFGQEALCSNKAYSVNAVAMSKVEVASLSKASFKKVIREISSKQSLELLEFLQSVSLFARWSKYDLTKLLKLFKLKNFNKNQRVFKQNDTPSHVYFIAKGIFVISKSLAKPLTSDKPPPTSQLYKRFENKKPAQLMNFDLVLKGEKEILGAEDVLNKSEFRSFSCKCSSAVGQLYCVRTEDFLQKLMRSELDRYSRNIRIDSEWLCSRSKDVAEGSALARTFNMTVTHKDKMIGCSTTKPAQRRKATSLSVQANRLLQRPNDSMKLMHVSKEIIRPLPELSLTVNIHMARVKRANKRLAPPNFLMKLRQKLTKPPGFPDFSTTS